ncbi:MAG: sodium-dependent transporter [Candidatus Glassbacteria bacterium]
MQTRERWGTKLGLILAMAGNAIGLGNFLRFPVQATQNGGGAFMIPYFTAFLLLGIPLMWMEWAMGRYGGLRGVGSTPGIFRSVWSKAAASYLGILGVLLPLIIVIYYTYIESWTLAFSFFSITGKYFGASTREAMGNFLTSFQGVDESSYFKSILPAYTFFLITLTINIIVLWKGISRGIEKLARIAMPILFLFAIILVVRVLTLGSPVPEHPEWSIGGGLAFIWNPNLAMLSDGSIWLAAAGQMFFTLSVGTGSILVYASYLRKTDDIALTGITTAVTNEFSEVILGGTIAIPAAFAFFGATETLAIARGGAFDLGFQSLPVIFQKIPVGNIFGCLWFLLLFFAGVTSSVAQSQPSVAFLHDELGLSRHRAVMVLGLLIFLCAQPVIFFLGHGFLDEMDYWAGTFGLVLLAAVEMILFAWVFRMERAWDEIHRGAGIRIPRVFYYIMKYVTPLYLIVLLIAWFYQSGIDVLLMRNVPPGDEAYRWGARILIAGLAIIIALLVRLSLRMKKYGIR